MPSRSVRVEDAAGVPYTIDDVPEDVTDEDVLKYVRGLDQGTFDKAWGSDEGDLVRRTRLGRTLEGMEPPGILRQEEAGATIGGSILDRGLANMPGSQASELKHRFSTGRTTREGVEEKIGALADMGIDPANILLIQPDEVNRPEDVAILYKPLEAAGEGDPWVELNTPGQAGLGDAADVLSSVLSLNTVMSTIPSLIPGIGPIPRLGMEATGAGLGHILDSEVDRARGLELSPRGEVLGQAGVESAFAGLFGAPFEVAPAIRGMRQAGGSGLMWGAHKAANKFGLPPDVTELNKSVQDMWSIYNPDGSKAYGLPEVTVADVHPILATMQRMAAKTGIKARTAQLERLEQIALRMRKQMKDLRGEGASADEITSVVDKWEKELLNTLNTPFKGSTLTSARITRDSLDEFVRQRGKIHGEYVARANTYAMEDGVVYRLAEDQMRVDELLTGVVGYGRKPDVPPGMVDELLRTGADPDAVRAASFDFQTIHAPKGELADTMAAFLSMPETLEGVPYRGMGMSSYKQLVGFRERLLKFVDRDNPVEDEVASEFLAIIDNRLANPIGGSDAFTVASRRADKYAASTQKVTRGLQTRELTRELIDTPERMGNDLISSSNPDRIKQMRGIMHAMDKPDKWNSVVSGYTNKLLRNPQDIEKELMKFSKPIRRALYSESEEAGLIKFSREWAKFQSEPLVRLAREQQRLGDEAIRAILSGDNAQIELILKYTEGDSAVQRSLQAGIWQHLIDKSVTMESGKLVTNPGVAEGIIRQLDNSGKLDLIMSSDQIDRLHMFRKMLSYMPAEAGAGESLQAAELASGLFPYSPHKIPKAIQSGMKLYRNSTFARIFNDKSASKILQSMDDAVQVGAVKPSYARTMAVAMGTVIGDAETDASSIISKVPEVLESNRWGDETPWDQIILNEGYGAPDVLR